MSEANIKSVTYATTPPSLPHSSTRTLPAGILRVVRSSSQRNTSLTSRNQFISRGKQVRVALVCHGIFCVSNIPFSFPGHYRISETQRSPGEHQVAPEIHRGIFSARTSDRQ